MNFLLVLFLVFFVPLSLFLGWLAVVSLLGIGFRSRFSRSSIIPNLDSFGRSYLQTMPSTGPAMSEQIELQDMLTEPDHEE